MEEAVWVAVFSNMNVSSPQPAILICKEEKVPSFTCFAPLLQIRIWSELWQWCLMIYCDVYLVVFVLYRDYEVTVDAMEAGGWIDKSRNPAAPPNQDGQKLWWSRRYCMKRNYFNYNCSCCYSFEQINFWALNITQTSLESFFFFCYVFKQPFPILNILNVLLRYT